MSLLEQVRDVILSYPERLNMESWNRSILVQGESCGTVCCIAGHGFEIMKLDIRGYCTEDIINMAAKIFELPVIEAMLLFFFDRPTGLAFARRLLSRCTLEIQYIFTETDIPAEQPYFDLQERISEHKPGTLAYAQIAAEAIDRCIARNQVTAPELISVG